MKCKACGAEQTPRLHGGDADWFAATGEYRPPKNGEYFVAEINFPGFAKTGRVSKSLNTYEKVEKRWIVERLENTLAINPKDTENGGK